MKIFVGRINPHLIRDFRIIRRHEMREHQSFDRSGLRNSTRIFRGSLMSQDAGFEGPRVRYTRNEAVKRGHLHCRVHQDVGLLREFHQVLAWSCIAGNHDRTVRSVEAISECRKNRRVIH
jgi:hypothetical protein